MDASLPQASRYESLGEVARGGMGVVLRVRDRSLDRTLAMKRMLAVADADSGDETAAKFGRFLEEAQITAQLDHPAIVPVHELGTDADGATYYTMKLVRGRELGEVFALARKGEGWNTARALGVLVRVCQAVAFAHGKGVVHRDLKPANVMAGDLGEVYVMDWGLAKMAGREDVRDIRLRLAASGIGDLQTVAITRDDLDGALDAPLMTMDGAVVGTPAYMPPEQAAGRVADVDHLSDLYALGAMLYDLLTGQPPYMPAGKLTTAREVLNQVLTTPPERVRTVNANADPELAAICEKAMAREKAERYANAADLAEDLQAYLDGRVVAAYERGAWAEMRKWVRRNRSASIGAAAALIAVLAGLGATVFIQSRAAERQRVLLKNEQAAKQEALHTLADSRATLGLRDAEDGDMARAALWFTEAAALCADDPVRERLNRTRAREYSRRALTPVRAWLLGGTKFESLEFSPRGDWLLVRSHVPPQLRLLDVSREMVREGDFSEAAFHPDGERIAVACEERVELRRLADDAVEASIPGPAGLLRFSGDGRWLCLGGAPARVWNVREGRLLEAGFDAGGAVHHAEFNEQGTRLLLTAQGKAVLLEMPSGRRIAEPAPHILEAGSRLPPSFLPGGRFFTFATKDEFALWDAETGRSLSRTRTGGGYSGLSADGSILFGPAAITSTADGRSLSSGELPNLSRVRLLSDGTLITATESPVIFDPVSQNIIARLGKHISYLSGTDVTRDGTLAATLEYGGLVRVWPLVRATDRRRVEGRGKVSFAADGRHFLANTGSAACLYTSDGELAAPPVKPGSSFAEAVLSPDSRMIYMRSGPEIQAWRVPEGTQAFTAKLPADTDRMTMSANSERIAVSGLVGTAVVNMATGAVTLMSSDNARYLALTEDGKVLAALAGELRVFDTASGAQRFPPFPVTGQVQGLNIRGRHLAVWRNLRMGGEQPCFFDLDTGKPLNSALDYPYIGVPMRGEFSEDGSLFLFSGLLPGLKVWDWRSGKEVCPDLPHRGWVTASFVPGTPWIVSAGNRPDPGSIHVWDRGTGQEVAPPWSLLAADGNSLTISPDGRTAVAGDNRNMLHVFNLDGLHTINEPLPPVDLAELAILNSGYRVFASGLMMLSAEEFMERWASFRRRHPHYHQLQFTPEELRRWHDYEADLPERSALSQQWHRDRLKH